MWSYYSIEGFGWFRIFGFGLYWKDTLKYNISFSERNGYRKTIKFGTWIIGVLSKI